MGPISRRAACLGFCDLLIACAATPPTPVRPKLRTDEPLSAVQAEAIGRIIDLPENIRPAFSGKGFEPPLQRANARSTESGEGFERYVRTFPQVPSMERNSLALQPLGELHVNPEIVREYISIFYGLPVTTLPADVSEGWVSLARSDKVTGRHLFASDALRYIRARLPQSAFTLVGMTEDALHADGSWGFVYGASSPDERIGVFTFQRAVPPLSRTSTGEASDDPHILRQYLKAASHEIGHAFGFTHCPFFSCLMAEALSLDEASQRPIHLCPVCLRKLYWATRVDVPVRYQRLVSFYRRYGLDPEATWTTVLLQDLRPPKGRAPSAT
jgi:archaemetzincin